MKTKYIKVNTADRPPEEDGKYYTELGLLNYNEETELFYNLRGKIRLADECFLEVPDKEEEMREMLQRMHSALTELRDIDENSEIFRSIIPEEINELLNELQNKP
ncbi:hypothetical protein FY557_17355 [Chryseobacterium sp. SN22]|uniref:hypothetical protein n=1 Tax=Chryseobacterium sp. SN22 TaxID=2606431 RepID=UPI0011F072A5|nr:hypothetical protein [Chryseobacterium sp. SN22]KAA0126418.1 hypothetical protein FY557_17355 [Chryseobacterium sp. SN22]